MDKKRRILQIAQLIIAFILNLMFIYTASDNEEEILILKGGMLLIPIALWFIQIILFAIETKFKSNKVRMFYLIVVSIILFMIISDLEFAAAASMIFSIVYLIMMILVFIFGNNENKITQNDANEKTLQIGYFSKKHCVIFTTAIIIATLISIGIYYVLFEVISLDIIPSFLIVFFILFFTILITNKFSNPLLRSLDKFNKTLDFDVYEKEINELLENNLHSESINYLKMLYINYLYMVDMKSALNGFSELHRPEYKLYQMQYDLLAVINAINLNDEEKARELFEFFRTNYKRYKQNIISLERLIEINFTNNEMTNIKSYYPIDNNSIVFRIVNCNTLMVYYSKRGMMDEAKIYAKFIVEHAPKLKQIFDEASAILEHTNVE